jgi:hypothetical protein
MLTLPPIAAPSISRHGPETIPVCPIDVTRTKLSTFLIIKLEKNDAGPLGHKISRWGRKVACPS